LLKQYFGTLFFLDPQGLGGRKNNRVMFFFLSTLRHFLDLIPWLRIFRSWRLGVKSKIWQIGCKSSFENSHLDFILHVPLSKATEWHRSFFFLSFSSNSIIDNWNQHLENFQLDCHTHILTLYMVDVLDWFDVHKNHLELFYWWQPSQPA